MKLAVLVPTLELEDNYLGLGDSSTWAGSGEGIFVAGLAGVITPSGVVVNNIIGAPEILASGSITPVGELADLLIGMNDGVLEGYITPVGSIALQTVAYNVEVEGEILPSGSLGFTVGILLNGFITPTGVVATPIDFINVVGSISPTGDIITTFYERFGSGSGGSIKKKKKS
jgi:hypothetical protein